jgi:hypothetical protein
MIAALALDGVAAGCYEILREFTNTVYSNLLLERIVERSMLVLLNIQITFPSFSSKAVSPSVKLPTTKLSTTEL